MSSVANGDKGAERVDVALATYNGGGYIDALLASLAAQTHGNIHVHFSDDGSTDDTVAIAEGWADRLAIDNAGDGVRRGFVGNFGVAVAACDADYVVLCDQDDIWHPRKIEVLLEKARAIEARAGKATPLVVFSDLRLVDNNLQEIAPSFFSATNKSKFAHRLEHFVLGGQMPGCSMLINRALVDRAMPMPKVTSHDWWFMLVASALGQVHFVDEALIDYRQHQQNTIGIGKLNSGVKRLARILSAPGQFISDRRGRWTRNVTAVRSNIALLKAKFGDDLSPRDKRMVNSTLGGGGAMGRLWLVTGRDMGERWFDRVAFWWLLGRRGD